MTIKAFPKWTSQVPFDSVDLDDETVDVMIKKMTEMSESGDDTLGPLVGLLLVSKDYEYRYKNKIFPYGPR